MASPASGQSIALSSAPVPPLDSNPELYWGAFVGLVIAIATVATVIMVRRLKKHHLEVPAVAMATVLACGGMMWWAKPWHPPSPPSVLLVRIVVCACFLAWASVILLVWILSQRDLKAVRQAMVDQAKQAKVPLDEQTAHREQLRSDVMTRINEEIKRLESSFGGRAIRIEKSLHSVGLGLDSIRTDWLNGRATDDGTIARLTNAIDLIHLELGKIPVRWKAELDLIRGGERVVHHGDGTRTVKPPTYGNIEELSEKLVAVIGQLAELRETLMRMDEQIKALEGRAGKNIMLSGGG